MTQIVAVILTYNRKDLLTRCLEAVYAQSRPCDRVIVIDNASTDGTEQMLLGMPWRNLEVYVLSANIGASGGFNAGFRLAHQRGADFVWMMDDDVLPAPDALQKLLEADGLLRDRQLSRSFLLSTAFTETGLITNAPALDVRHNTISYENWPSMVEFGMVPVRRATFVSILVPRETLDEHGLPIAAMFIWGEDTEYTLRISQKAPGYVVGASKVVHLRQESGALSIVTERSPSRLKYHRHHVRNTVFIARKYARQRRLLLVVTYQLALLCKLLGKRQFGRAGIVLTGLWESLWFYPLPEAIDAPIENLKVTVRAATPVVRAYLPAPDPQLTPMPAFALELDGAVAQ